MFISSTTNLANNATFTSNAYNTDRTDKIAGTVFSDQAGTLYIEQSSDGTNWDVSTSYGITANDGKGFSEDLYAPYVRVRFTNTGGSTQTAFRLFAKSSSAGDS
jgi:hypothetical protein